MIGDEESKPSLEEIFEGRDVAAGKEIVEGLRTEGVGLSVYRIFPSERKTNVLFDRKPGEDDYTVRETTEMRQQLQGIVLPTNNNKDEYIYFGIREQGVIFNTNGKDVDRFDYRINPSYSHAHDQFASVLSVLKMKVELREDDDPEKYQQILVSTVALERDKAKQIKSQRGEKRNTLLGKLFNR